MNNIVKLLNSAFILSRLVTDAVTEWATTQAVPVAQALAGARQDFMKAAVEENLPAYFLAAKESFEESGAALSKFGEAVEAVFESSEEEV